MIMLNNLQIIQFCFNRTSNKLQVRLRVKPEVLKQLVLELRSMDHFTFNQISNVLERTENHIIQK